LKQTALIAGVGSTCFGKHLDRSLSELAKDAIEQALRDSGIELEQIQAVWAGNAAAPVITGQVCIAGQVIMSSLGLGRVPVVNVENACATSSTALQQAASMVTLGGYDVVLAFGVDKLYHSERQRAYKVFDGCTDVEHPETIAEFLYPGEQEPGTAVDGRSVFMKIYARWARDLAARGATETDYAAVVAKNSLHGSLNPNAYYRKIVSVEEVLRSTSIAPPLTRMMCSPLADGAAAAVIVSEKAARRLGISHSVRILSCVLASGHEGRSDEEPIVPWAARQAFEHAGVGPEDLSCVELHDATSPAELMCYEALGMCAGGEAMRLVREEATRLGGRIPVNTSGGLVRKGHPIGATGLSQIHELTLQLRGQAGSRQVQGARIALAENAGGFVGGGSAAVVMTVLAK
jgi:acetyl-CoA acetyltransferase